MPRWTRSSFVTTRIGVIALLHRLVGDKERFDEVIGLGARADAGHVRADLPAGAAVGVAGGALQFLAAEDQFAPRRIGLERIGDERLHLVGGGRLLGRAEVAGLGERGHESIGRLGRGSHGLQAELGDIGVELLVLQEPWPAPACRPCG